MINLNIKKRKGFGMAETLVALLFIGVVCAMTIPSLLRNSQKEQTVASLLKVFGTFNEVYKRSQVDNGLGETWANNSNDEWWDTYINPYLSTTKQCTYSNRFQCWAQDAKFLDGTDFYTATTGFTRSLILRDGMLVCYICVSGDNYAIIFVDVNGFKKPNVVGKDIFRINIFFRKGYVALGGSGSDKASILSNSCNKVLNAVGWKGSSCAAIIQIDGWKIADDYPWN